MSSSARSAVGRYLASAMACALALAGLVACGGGSDTDDVTVDENGRLSEPTTITMTVPCQSLACFPPFLFNDWSEFEERNLTVDVSVVPSTDAVALAATGEIDVFNASLNVGLLNAIAGGSDVQVVAPNYELSDENNAGFYVSTKQLGDREFDPSMLEGQTIASSQGNAGGSMVMLLRLLEEGGLTPDDVTIEMMPEADQIPALENGAIFMGILNEPSTTMVLESGGAVNVGRVTPDGYPAGVYAFGETMLGENDAVGKAFVSAVRASNANRLQGDYMADQEMVERIAAVLEQPVDLVSQGKSDVYPETLSMPSPWVEPHIETWEQFPDLLQGDASTLTDEDVVDDRFMEFANGITP